MALLEYKICLATDTPDGYDHCAGEHHVGAVDGTIAGIRKIIIASIMFTYLLVTVFYSWKIGKMLKGSGKSKMSREEKKIRRWCLLMSVAYAMGIWMQFGAIGPRWNRTIYQLIPCNDQGFVFQYGRRAKRASSEARR